MRPPPKRKATLETRQNSMSRKKRLIIPIFIPFGGCPNQCVFCDQKGITGGSALPSIKEVTDTIDSYLSTWKGTGVKEAAFYGGTFTALPEGVQLDYLNAAYGYIKSGKLDNLRISTRPDRITGDIAVYLKGHGVRTVELGVQSMSGEVLRLSGRGHSPKDTVDAVKLLKGFGFETGAQIMPGLPGDTLDSILMTAEAIIALRPDFVRIYPTLVLKNTPLYKMFLSGDYKAWSLEEMVSACREALKKFREADIPVIRMGLQPTADLEANLAAGPYHPSFRQLVEN